MSDSERILRLLEGLVSTREAWAAETAKREDETATGLLARGREYAYADVRRLLKELLEGGGRR